MASKLLQCATVTLATLSGFNQTTCYRKPDDPAKPHILFVHGFPSSSYDWRHQVEFFADDGYGIIAPDLLGYGDTDKPDGPDSYTLKKVSEGVNEIVSHVVGNDTKVVGVGHDWGAIVLSRLANYHPERFLSYSFVTVAYYPPGPSESDAKDAPRTAPRTPLGYQKFFNETDSGRIVDGHKDSFVDLLYPQNLTKTWTDHMRPANATRAWLTADTRGPRAGYITAEEFETHMSIFAKDGYTPALNYYRAQIRGLNAADERRIGLAARRTDLPVLYIGARSDPLVDVTGENEAIRAFASGATLEGLDSGHWTQLERAAEVNALLKKFLEGGGRGVARARRQRRG
ncbi:MAG: hypothetical protein M1832_004376 [Thelocarpon impressellum]|nr:MAG: hypothetical protein M1832_004376 [Thelocarpon impressellum]